LAIDLADGKQHRGGEPVTFDPLNPWAASLILGIGLDLNRHASWPARRRSMSEVAGRLPGSVDRIVPELQQVEVGEVLPMPPDGPGMRIEILEPSRVFVIGIKRRAEAPARQRSG
jgi:hypothetical protein